MNDEAITKRLRESGTLTEDDAKLEIASLKSEMEKLIDAKQIWWLRWMRSEDKIYRLKQSRARAVCLYHTYKEFFEMTEDACGREIATAQAELRAAIEECRTRKGIEQDAQHYKERAEQAETVVHAAIQIVAGYSMTNHMGQYIVGKSEYETLQRALEPYRIEPTRSKQ